MKKKLFIILTLNLVISLSLLSQITHTISFGPDLGLPSKNFGSETSLGIGGSLEYQFKFNAPVGLQLHAGYNHFPSKLTSNDNINFFPLRAGIVGFVYHDIMFISADFGISYFDEPGVEDYTKSGFSYGVGAGYKIYVNPDKKQFLQLTAYYNSHKYKDDRWGQNYNYTWFNIRAAYGFSFR